MGIRHLRGLSCDQSKTFEKIMEWERPWPELEGLSELERYHLVRKARKQFFSRPEGYLVATACFAAAVGLILAIQQLARFFLGSSVWVYSLSFLVGLFIAMHLYDRWYGNRLRRVVQLILHEKKNASDQSSE
jgi:hypothetical protein